MLSAQGLAGRRVVLSIDEVAELLGFHRETVRRAIARGVIPASRIGRTYLIPRKYVEGLAAGQNPGPVA